MGILLFLWLISGCFLSVPFIFFFISNRKTKTIVVRYLNKMLAVFMGIFCAMGGIFLMSMTYENSEGTIAGLFILLFGLLLIWIGVKMKPGTSLWDKWWQKKWESFDDKHK